MLLARLAAAKEECFIVREEVMQEESEVKGHNLLVHKMLMCIGSAITVVDQGGSTVQLLHLSLGQQ